MMTDRWRQGQILEIEITDLNSTGEGVGRWRGRVVFVPDTTPGDRILTRLTQVKPTYAVGKCLQIVEASPNRVRPACIVADKCGGCQWQVVSYAAQLEAKQRQVEAALRRIGGDMQSAAGDASPVTVAPILGAQASLAYRNKATYPLRRSPQGKVQAGYYRKGTHQIVNLNQCPVQDARLNPLLVGVKHDIQQQGWRIYDEKTQQGHLRHLSLRVGRRTGQMLLTLVSAYRQLKNLAVQAQLWLHQYPGLVGVALNHNPHHTNTLFGPETLCIAGQDYLEERFAGLQFRIQPATFFQIYTEQAERLLAVIVEELALNGDEYLVDAYCGIGAITLPLAQRVRHCIGLEVHSESIKQAALNAKLNGLTNVTFLAGSVESLLPSVIQMTPDKPDIILLDPPRKGCAPAVIDSLLALNPPRIVYVSCNPATLARDLKRLCSEGGYQLTRLQPADFFPQTSHVECVAFLVR